MRNLRHTHLRRELPLHSGLVSRSLRVKLLVALPVSRVFEVAWRGVRLHVQTGMSGGWQGRSFAGQQRGAALTSFVTYDSRRALVFPERPPGAAAAGAGAPGGAFTYEDEVMVLMCAEKPRTLIQPSAYRRPICIIRDVT